MKCCKEFLSLPLNNSVKVYICLGLTSNKCFIHIRECNVCSANLINNCRSPNKICLSIKQARSILQVEDGLRERLDSDDFSLSLQGDGSLHLKKGRCSLLIDKDTAQALFFALTGLLCLEKVYNNRTQNLTKLFAAIYNVIEARSKFLWKITSHLEYKKMNMEATLDFLRSRKAENLMADRDAEEKWIKLIDGQRIARTITDCISSGDKEFYSLMVIIMHILESKALCLQH